MFRAWLDAWYYTPEEKLAVLPASWEGRRCVWARPAVLEGRKKAGSARFQYLNRVSGFAHTHTLAISCSSYSSGGKTRAQCCGWAVQQTSWVVILVVYLNKCGRCAFDLSHDVGGSGCQCGVSSATSTSPIMLV